MDLNNDHPRNKTTQDGTVQLCASCDRCRSRKTKCDGERPCGNCASKYMKKHKITSIEGIDLDEFECFYSPAKRRGPHPGRSSGANKAKGGNAQQQPPQPQSQPSMPVAAVPTNNTNSSDFNNNAYGNFNAGDVAAAAATNSSMDAQLAALIRSGGGVAAAGNFAPSATVSSAFGGNQQGQVDFQSQLHQLQQQQQQQQHMRLSQQQSQPFMASGKHQGSGSDTMVLEQPMAQRVKMDDSQQQSQTGASKGGIPQTIATHTHLLDRTDPDGCRFRAYYTLSIDELFRLPVTPTDEEYCTRINLPSPTMIPGTHLAALSAARFVEASLGAVVHNEVGLAMELCNATVHCLRESVKEPVQLSVMFEVSKAYFLLGVFRAFRGDMPRYFKYRRVCLTYLSKLETDERTKTLLAAVSLLDSWAYMVYNADEKDIPDVDETIPPVSSCRQGNDPSVETEVERKFNITTSTCAIACNPQNKNWIQGAPSVYLDNEAPSHARINDALACAIRNCCDQANNRFNEIAKDADPRGNSSTEFGPTNTVTASAVLANQDELCSRNIVLSAYTLMQQSESVTRGQSKSEGQHLVISAMDAFLENGDENIDGGFTDSQIQSLLSVCNSAVENPFLLHHAGPTYHMVSNATILLCHLLNGMQAMKGTNQFGPMETTMFEEVVDTVISVRRLLTIHRRKLPVRLRCHGIPRPQQDGLQPGQPIVDMGETILCSCRGCQGFVLMACSPCVAAERARSSARRMEVAEAQEAEAGELGEIPNQELLGSEFDLDDDALLNMISSLVAN